MQCFTATPWPRLRLYNSSVCKGDFVWSFLLLAWFLDGELGMMKSALEQTGVWHLAGCNSSHSRMNSHTLQIRARLPKSLITTACFTAKTAFVSAVYALKAWHRLVFLHAWLLSPWSNILVNTIPSIIVAVCQITVHSDTFFYEWLLGTCLYSGTPSHVENTDCEEKGNEKRSADKKRVSINSTCDSLEYQDTRSNVKRKSIRSSRRRWLQTNPGF